MFYDVVYAFGVGIAFSVGIAVGAALMLSLAIMARRKESAQHLEQTKRCEDRLEGYVLNSGRIASVLERMEKQEERRLNRIGS